MNKLFYPALFHKSEEGGFWISFPDIPECLTQGNNMTQVYEMAVDALGLILTDYEREILMDKAFPDSKYLGFLRIIFSIKCLVSFTL